MRMPDATTPQRWTITRVEWAELILQYLQVLVWPAMVVVALVMFRRPLSAKIADLKDATTPVGSASFFDQRAKDVGEAASRLEADTLIPNRASAPLEGATGRPAQEVEPAGLGAAPEIAAVIAAVENLSARRDFETARDLVAASPRAAVLLAYADLERVVRAAYVVKHLQPAPSYPLPRLLQSSEFFESFIHSDPQFLEIARALSDLRNRVAHGSADVSPDGALDYIGGCESLASTIEFKARSIMRHPSRSQVFSDWIESYLEKGPDTP